MRVKIKLYPNERVKDVVIEDKATVKVLRILRMLGLNQYHVIVVVNGRVVMEDYDVKDGDIVEIYEVISTG